VELLREHACEQLINGRVVVGEHDAVWPCACGVRLAERPKRAGFV